MLRSVRSRLRWSFGLALLVLSAPSGDVRAEGKDHLPSWEDGTAKRRIVEFVARVTAVGGPDFVATDDRIATFDNDGTLWCEQPVYTQAVFVFDRIKALAPQHPGWRTAEPFRSILEGDRKTLALLGERGIVDLTKTTHSGLTIAEYRTMVRDWLASARHPRFKRPYVELVYQPMLELLAYLRANGFRTYIVSGGGIEFMRVWVDKAYGIPPEEVVGSSLRTAFTLRDGVPEFRLVPEVDFVDNGPGKAVGIQRFIGRRPIAAFGNSDGDLQMLQYATAGPGTRLGLVIHHTDAAREYAYDRASIVGTLDKALDEAGARRWIVVDMKTDWRRVFPPGE